MKILTINSLKGGTSKSTLALNLYYYYTQLGKIVAIADSDPQGSLSELLINRNDVPLIYRENITTWKELRSIEDVDVIIIDTAPYMMAELHDIFMISDFILIPFSSSALDISSMNHTIESFYKAQDEKPNLKGAVILTRGIHGTQYNAEALEAVKTYELPILKTQMMQRVEYSRSITEERGIFSSENHKAKREIKKIGSEILKIWEI